MVTKEHEFFEKSTSSPFAFPSYLPSHGDIPSFGEGTYKSDLEQSSVSRIKVFIQRKRYFCVLVIMNAKNVTQRSQDQEPETIFDFRAS